MGTLAGVPRLSVVVITLNEAPNIDDALASVSWADEIVVVDCGSTDETVPLARRYTDHVSHRDWTGYGDQKNHATALAKNDWVLSLDADERISAELASEIMALIEQDPTHRGYRVPRTTRYLGRWIRTTDWYPDYQLRLYDRQSARWTRKPVHESVRIDGSVGRLRHEIHHYAYPNLSNHVATINRYTTLAAKELLDHNHKAGSLDLLVRPTVAFVRNYLLRRGFTQGLPGLVVSLMNTYYVLLKYVKLWELGRTKDKNQHRNPKI